MGESLLDAKTPVGAVEFIISKDLKGNIYHPQIFGDYMLWKLAPRQKVFFDGRVHLYGEEVVRDYFRIQDASDWEDNLNKYNIRYLLLKKEDKKEKHNLLNRALNSKNWEVIFEDPVAILLEKIGRKRCWENWQSAR